MKFEDLLEELNRNEISLEINKDKLKIYDPNEKLNQALVSGLKKYKSDLMEWLSKGSEFTGSDFIYSKLTSNQISEIENKYEKLENVYIATPMQTGFLFHGMLDGTGASYTVHTCCNLNGEVDSNALRLAWERVVSRHDVLRTCFVGLESEQVHQAVLKEVSLPFCEEDWSGFTREEQAEKIKKLHAEDKARGFNFDVPPLMRIYLIKLSSDRYHFLWSHHHVLLDGWCNPILFSEVIEYYISLITGAEAKLPTINSYEKYIGWLFNQNKTKAKAFWQEHLKGFKSSNDVSVKQTSAKKYNRIEVGRIPLTVDKEVCEKLDDIAKKSSCTMNIIMQAAWSYLLHRYSGDTDVVFGATVSGRPPQIEGVESMMGLFINTIPVRVDYKKPNNFNDLVSSLRRGNLDRTEYDYLPLSEIQGVSEVKKGESIFDTILVFENYPINQSVRDGINKQSRNFSIDDFSTNSQNNFDLSLISHYRNDILHNELLFQKSKFSEKNASNMLRHLNQILNNIAEGGLDLELHSLDIVNALEKDYILNKWIGSETDFPGDKCIHQLFESQVQKSPYAIAVEYGESQVTYKELDERANKLARVLVDKGVGPGRFVPIYLERSIEVLTSILAILKAGGAYVPLDLSLPKNRLSFLIKDCGSSIVLTSEKMEGLLPEGEYAAYSVDDKDNMDTAYRKSSEKLDLSFNSDAFSYIIYTSGTTGNPKGVLVSHRNLVNFVVSAKNNFLLDHIKGSVVSSPVSFDATVQSLFVPLISGKYVKLLPEDSLPIAPLAESIFGEGDDLLFKITPSHLRALKHSGIGHNLKKKHVFVVAGEKLSYELACDWKNEILPNSKFINEYGPTEATVGSCIYNLEKEDKNRGFASSVPIGMPLDNVKCLVLDDCMRVQPVGVAGELYIGGEGVAHSYLNQEGLTRERFLQIDIPNVESGRFYKTGDLVRRLPDGNLEFISRTDNQVKIRGFRVELDEIENSILEIENVKNAVALLKTKDENNFITSYIETESSFDSDEILREAQESVLLDSIEKHLSKNLPDYMLPSTYVFIDCMPMTSSGKVDKKALPDPDIGRKQGQQYVAPENETEKKLCALWEDVLKIEKIGVLDNYFSMGGDSIIAIQIVSRAKQLDMKISVRDLLENPSVGQLAPFVEFGESIASQEEVVGDLNFLPITRRFFYMGLKNPHHYNQTALLETPKKLSEKALSEMIESIYVRHDILRSRYSILNGNISAKFHSLNKSMLDKSILLQDLRDVKEEDIKREVNRICVHAQESLNISDGPMLKAVYIDIGKERNLLFLVAHHLVVDGVSWRVLLSDLERGWQCLSDNNKVELLPKGTSFQYWSNKLNDYSTSNELKNERDYWIGKLKTPLAMIPKSFEEVSNRNEMQTSRFQLSETETTALLGECNKIFKTQINELLLSAFYLAYSEWVNSSSMRIEMESHGREEMFDGVDLGETLGWFTSIYPLVLKHEEDRDIVSIVKSIKKQYREVPQNGIGYGVLKYISKDPELLSSEVENNAPPIKFNYLGKIDSAIDVDTGFRSAQGYNVGEPVSRENMLPQMMNVKGEVFKGKLSFKVSLSKEYKSIDGLAESFQSALISIVRKSDEINDNKKIREKNQALEVKETDLLTDGIKI